MGKYLELNRKALILKCLMIHELCLPATDLQPIPELACEVGFEPLLMRASIVVHHNRSWQRPKVWGETEMLADCRQRLRWSGATGLPEVLF